MNHRDRVMKGEPLTTAHLAHVWKCSASTARARAEGFVAEGWAERRTHAFKPTTFTFLTLQLDQPSRVKVRAQPGDETAAGICEFTQRALDFLRQKPRTTHELRQLMGLPNI